MRRRLAGLLLVLAVIAGAAWFARRKPVNVELDVGLPASVREVDLVFTRNDEHVERELKLLYAGGAPTRDHRSLRLSAGRYNVGARLVFANPPELTTTRSLDVNDSGTYSLDF
jgi:hypothetical protein